MNRRPLKLDRETLALLATKDLLAARGGKDDTLLASASCAPRCTTNDDTL